MTNQDFLEFADLWQGVHSNMNFGKTYDQSGMKFVFKLLSDYPINAIEQAVNVYARQNSNAPQPNQIIELLNAGNSRLSAQESWAIMPKSETESGSVTTEMLEAWAICEDLYLNNQYFAAEKAFLAAYERLAKEADLQNQPVVWQLSRGTDAAHFESAVKEAMRLNRLQSEKAHKMLALIPSNENVGVAGLLSGNINTEFAKRNADKCKVILDALKEIENREAAELARIETRRLQIIAQAEELL
jgi:hypothetical protein